MSKVENTRLTAVNVYATVYDMSYELPDSYFVSDQEYEESFTDYCAECCERESFEALVPVLVATKHWPYVEKLVHAGCRDRFVASNLTAVLTSLRGATL